MKAEEIRGYLKTWPPEEILKLYTATYRKVPKEKKDEIDELIKAGPGAPKKKAAPKMPKVDDLDENIEKLDHFVDLAMEGKYYYANREVSKKERSNWRFTCGRFIKYFQSFGPESEDFDDCTYQLGKIYDILCRATSFYTFASQDPFHTLGYESQTEFFRLIAERTMQGSRDEVMLESLIQSACNGQNDYETVDCMIHHCLLSVMADCVEMDDILRMTENLFEPVKKEYEASYKGRFSTMITEREIELHDQYDSLGWFIPAVYVRFGECLKAYSYAMDLDVKSNKEIDLYCLLSYYVPKGKDWLLVYDQAVKDGIEPREELQESYAKIKKELVVEK